MFVVIVGAYLMSKPEKKIQLIFDH
jgi:hypothetical protein